MTLTSSPCDLDNMSLFQNLKLKRGKVDSRCSSDGKNHFIHIYICIGSVFEMHVELISNQHPSKVSDVSGFFRSVYSPRAVSLEHP